MDNSTLNSQLIWKDDIRSLQQELGWRENAVLTGFSLMDNGDGWRVTVKADFPGGPKYSALQVDGFARAVEVLCEYVRLGWLDWSHDSYPPKRRRRRRLRINRSSVRGGADILDERGNSR